MRQKYEKFVLLETLLHCYLDCYICLQIVSMSEVLVPIVMMFVLCIVHSHIVSTHSGPTMMYNQSRQRITRRSRHVRGRNGKSRPRQNLRKCSAKNIHLYYHSLITFIYNIQIFTEGIHKDLKSSQDMTSEKASTGSEEVFTAVRFAKKVVIQNSSTISQSQVNIQIHNIKIL